MQLNAFIIQLMIAGSVLAGDMGLAMDLQLLDREGKVNRTAGIPGNDIKVGELGNGMLPLNVHSPSRSGTGMSSAESTKSDSFSGLKPGEAAPPSPPTPLPPLVPLSSHTVVSPVAPSAVTGFGRR